MALPRFHKWIIELIRLTILATALATLLRSAHAQDALGGLRGQVIDADFKEPVPGVRILISELGRSATTNSTGRFIINAIPPGVYNLLATREGFIRQPVDQILVSAGQVREIEVKLFSDVFQLEDMELQPEDEFTPGGAEELLGKRDMMVTFADIVGTKFIQESGARDAAGALRRMTGTSILDGKYVVVRGLADRYVNVLVNGGRVPNADPDRRSVSVDLFPSAVLGGITTSKTFTPDQPGDSTGGTVDIQTRSLPDKFTAALSAGVEYNTNTTGNDEYVTYRGGGAGMWGRDAGGRGLPPILRNPKLGLVPQSDADRALIDQATRSVSPIIGTSRMEAPANYNYSINIGDRLQLFDRPFGYNAAFTYRRNYQILGNYLRGRYQLGTPGAQTLFGDLFGGVASKDETTVGGLVSLGWQPAPDNEIGVNVLINQNGQDEVIYREELNSENPELREILHYTQRQLRTVQFRGDHRLVETRDVKVNWSFTASEASQDEPDYRVFKTEFNEETGQFQPLGSAGGDTAKRFWRSLDDTAYSARLDVKIPIFDDEGADAPNTLKIGAAFDLSDREYNQLLTKYLFGGANGEFNGYRDPLGQTKWSDVFLEDQRIGLAPGTQQFNWFLASISDLGTLYTARQVLGAGYFMFDLKPLDPVRLVVGGRLESTDLSVRGVGPVPPGFDSNQATIQETDLLPSLSLSIDLTSNQKLRLAYGRTIARPSFKELGPVYIEDFTTDETFRGNPDLVLSTIDNYDVRWEWYPRPGEVVAVSAFTKILDEPIERSSTRDDELGIIYVQKRNFDRALVYGAEFEYRKKLDTFIPGLEMDPMPILDGMTFGFNFSYFLSQVPLSPDLLAERRVYGVFETNRRLEGQPDYTCNFSLTYEDVDLGWNAGVFYNVTGPYLYTVGERGTPDVFEEPAGSLDAYLGFKMGKNWSVTLRAKNLLNSTFKRSYEFKGQEYIYQSFDRGIDYSLTVGLNW